MASTKLHEALTVPSAQELPVKSGVLTEPMSSVYSASCSPRICVNLSPDPPHPQSQQTTSSTHIPGINRNQLRESSHSGCSSPPSSCPGLPCLGLWLPAPLLTPPPPPTPPPPASQSPNLFPFPGFLPSPCKSAHTSPRTTKSCLKPTAPPRCPLSLSFYPSLPQRVLFKSLFISGSDTVSPQPPTFHGNVSPRSSLTLLLNWI